MTRVVSSIRNRSSFLQRAAKVQNICYHIAIMTELTRDDVLKLAQLARLSLTDDEVEEFRSELSAILEYVRQLQDVDVTGLKPTTQVSGLTNVMREDTLIDYGINRADLLRNVPKTEEELIKVKRMVG
jgi:aspartyl-tRNA(Asn)/glutamyl-tRNA(Gln) amidotransferase subunit C